MAINIGNAQNPVNTNMNNIDYQHNISISFQAKSIQMAMGWFGMEKTMEKKMINNGFAIGPAKIPNSLLRKFNVQEIDQNGRKVWTISPKKSKSDVVILFLHGGAYMGNISKPHWALVTQILSKTNATIVIPDYPLAPESTCKETYDFIEILYARLTTDYPTKHIVIMGDSAGGGLSVGFVQQLRNQNKKQPEQIIVFSPWLDIAMNNPDIKNIDQDDKLLSIEGLKNAGKKYAGDLDLKDFRVSPIYGDFTGMCRISVFTGTKDILNADAQKFKQLMNDQRISFNYFEYPGMFHDWVIITSLKESSDVIDKVSKLLVLK
jgi:acetyl esterase/lipase